MNTYETRHLEVGDQTVDVVRKDIKHLHLAVYPPTGRVRVAAPLRVDDETIRLAVVTRLPWIRQRQRHFNDQERQSAREFITGESHYVDGRRHRLRLVEASRAGVDVRPGRMLEIRFRPGSGAATVERTLDAWYRARIRHALPRLLAKWEPVIGVGVPEIGVKTMRTRWGSCNPRAGRVWLNVELAKKPSRCLEYVLVHEMAHLLERKHNEHFRDLMTQFLPGWQLLRDELNREPLGHVDWNY